MLLRDYLSTIDYLSLHYILQTTLLYFENKISVLFEPH